MELNRLCFGEALVAGETAGLQCADGLQGPEKEREREEEKEKEEEKKRCQTVTSHCQFAFQFNAFTEKH